MEGGVKFQLCYPLQSYTGSDPHAALPIAAVIAQFSVRVESGVINLGSKPKPKPERKE